MRTRIKETRKIVNGLFQSRFLVQALGNDGMFRTIEGGMCDSREKAEEIRKKYKSVGKFVKHFNEKYVCHTPIRLDFDSGRFKCHAIESNEGERD